MTSELGNAPLGKESKYISEYAPHLLFPVPRSNQRAAIGIGTQLPFKGVDFWNAFEVSWLNLRGKPVVATAEFGFLCDSPSLIESKSFKLYLNSFNNSRFESASEVGQIMQNDLSRAVGASVLVELSELSPYAEARCGSFSGFCLDDLDVSCTAFLPTPEYLKASGPSVHETVFSNLLKSNCMVTGQPDWASVSIEYRGNQIDHEALLQYLVSFRNHTGFHEDCVERIFKDIIDRCGPQELTVEAHYTRRGGLDINPFRTNTTRKPQKQRLFRQ